MILDSNIVIYAVTPEYQKVRDYLRLRESELKISCITRLEVLGYHRLTESEKSLLANFFASIEELSISMDILEQAITLRQGKKMSLGDALIAATALIEGDEIFTNNESDFQHIEGLNIIPMSQVLSSNE